SPRAPGRCRKAAGNSRNGHTGGADPSGVYEGHRVQACRAASRDRDHLLGRVEGNALVVPQTVIVGRSGEVTTVTIDRPDVHNCVDSDTADALEAAVREFDASDEQRVLVLTGAGDRAFCSGADLKNPPRLRDAGPMG